MGQLTDVVAAILAVGKILADKTYTENLKGPEDYVRAWYSMKRAINNFDPEAEERMHRP